MIDLEKIKELMFKEQLYSCGISNVITNDKYVCLVLDDILLPPASDDGNVIIYDKKENTYKLETLTIALLKYDIDLKSGVELETPELLNFCYEQEFVDNIYALKGILESVNKKEFENITQVNRTNTDILKNLGFKEIETETLKQFELPKEQKLWGVWYNYYIYKYPIMSECVELIKAKALQGEY